MVEGGTVLEEERTSPSELVISTGYQDILVLSPAP